MSGEHSPRGVEGLWGKEASQTQGSPLPLGS